MATDQPVSEATLRLLLAEFKTELVTELKNYATTAAHEGLEARVKLLEIWQAALTGASGQRQKASLATLAWAGLAVSAMTALATVVWLTHS